MTTDASILNKTDEINQRFIFLYHFHRLLSLSIQLRWRIRYFYFVIWIWIALSEHLIVLFCFDFWNDDILSILTWFLVAYYVIILCKHFFRWPLWSKLILKFRESVCVRITHEIWSFRTYLKSESENRNKFAK